MAADPMEQADENDGRERDGRNRGSGEAASVRWDVEGILAPVTTPFIDEDPALDNLERNIQMWLTSPLAGFVVLGATGEFPRLTFEEKIQVVESAVQSAEGRPVIAGTGSPSTVETVALTLAAADRGASAVLVAPPSAFGGALDEEELEEHFEAVADASPVPVLLYNFPEQMGGALDPDLVARLSGHPNIVGMKDSGKDLGRFGLYKASVPRDDFAFYTGWASLLLPALTLGAQGGILAQANVAPWECCELWELVQQGKWEEAADLQRRITVVDERVLAVYGIPGIKALLDMLGYFGGPPRQPMRALAFEELEEIRSILKDVRMLGC